MVNLLEAIIQFAYCRWFEYWCRPKFILGHPFFILTRVIFVCRSLMLTVLSYSRKFYVLFIAT